MNITEKVGIGVAAGVGILGLAVGLSLLLAIPTWLLWNWLLPPLFGLPTVTLWQAWGVNVLSSTLFKSVSLRSNK